MTTVPFARLAWPGQPLGLLDIGPVELLILAAAAVMLFGGDLPDMARRAGRLLGRLRASAQELTREVEPPPDLGDLPRPGEPDATDPAGVEGDPHAAPRGPDAGAAER